MRSQGDIKRRRSVKAEFDKDFSATALGGSVLIEKAMRALSLRRMIAEHLPERSAQARYSTVEGVAALVSALLAGGRGIEACEILRQDAMAEEIFGLAQGAPSPATTYRLLCELSGLAERCESDWYEKAGPRLDALDISGRPRRVPATRRLVPAAPEEADADRLAALGDFVRASARRCLSALPRNTVWLSDWLAVFGDATDLEVDGNCFDAARVGRDGRRALRWLTLMVGSVIVEQRLATGSTDEGRAMPDLLEAARGFINETAGREKRVLCLLDAAYLERRVIESIRRNKWHFIVCANQQRNLLERLAAEQPELIWRATGPDSRRRWSESQVGCLTHLPEGWSEPVTIIVRRWREEGELPGAAWHYSFLATSIEPALLPSSLRKRAGDYASAIWMLYGTKQGRENNYKTALRDLGLHHPPSGRLGVNQAFYALASAASNAAMSLRYGAMDKSDRGISLWRLREAYVRIAGYLVRTGQTLWVRLSGVSVGALRQTRWRHAFAAAGRL